MLPGILNQLGAESLSSLKKLASTVAGGDFLRKCDQCEKKEIVKTCMDFPCIHSKNLTAITFLTVFKFNY